MAANERQRALAQALWQFGSTPGGAAVGNPNMERQGIKATPWYSQFQQKFGEAPDLNSPDYDYQRAWQGGARPQPYQYDSVPHWPSSLPNGQELKAPNHPTYWMEQFMRTTGKDPNSLGITSPEQAQMYLLGK